MVCGGERGEQSERRTRTEGGEEARVRPELYLAGLVPEGVNVAAGTYRGVSRGTSRATRGLKRANMQVPETGYSMTGTAYSTYLSTYLSTY